MAICRVSRVCSAICSLLLLFVAATTSVTAQVAPDSVPLREEHLTYDVVYHWGIIWKRAAVGTLSLRHVEDGYRAEMTASTLPFADRIYKVRDTLVAEMRPVDLRPIAFTKVAREGRYHQVDRLCYQYPNDSTIAIINLTRPGTDYRVDNRLAVQGAAYDMLSIFYRVRQLPFATMQAGDMFSIPIFSGRRIEQLDIEYMGRTTVEVNKQPRDAYYLKFRFYDINGKKTADRISAWLSTDSLIPLQLEGKLPIGTMKVILTGER